MTRENYTPESPTLEGYFGEQPKLPFSPEIDIDGYVEEIRGFIGGILAQYGADDTEIVARCERIGEKIEALWNNVDTPTQLSLLRRTVECEWWLAALEAEQGGYIGAVLSGEMPADIKPELVVDV